MREAKICLILALAASPAPAMALEPVGLYGTDTLRYRIIRNDRTVGEHIIRFEESRDALTVSAQTTIQVPFLMFTAYRFSYQSSSVWRNGRLETLTARVNDDGNTGLVTARSGPEGLRLAGGTLAPPDTLPTDHWHPATREAQTLLNTLTGQLNDISVTAEGEDIVPVGSGDAQAIRFRVRGDLRLTTWYDAAGRWLGMRFTGQDGSTIRYVCDVCAPSSSPQLSERP